MYLFIILFILFFQNMVHAQDSSVEDKSVDSSMGISEDDLQENVENINLDNDQNYSDEDEDVFKPSDEVSYSQQIRFPVDI